MGYVLIGLGILDIGLVLLFHRNKQGYWKNTLLTGVIICLAGIYFLISK
jgi:hypothetical protein